MLIGQDIWQRVFTARSDKTAKWGGTVAGTYCLAYALAGAVIGTAATVLYPKLESADAAFATIVKDELPMACAVSCRPRQWCTTRPAPRTSARTKERPMTPFMISVMSLLEGAPPPAAPCRLLPHPLRQRLPGSAVAGCAGAGQDPATAHGRDAIRRIETPPTQRRRPAGRGG